MWTTVPRRHVADLDVDHRTEIWTTGPRRHVADLYVDHRTNTWQQNIHIYVDHTNRMHELLHANTEQDQPCGPLYRDRWTTIYQHTEQDQVM